MVITLGNERYIKTTFFKRVHYPHGDGLILDAEGYLTERLIPVELRDKVFAADVNSITAIKEDNGTVTIIQISGYNPDRGIFTEILKED